MQVVDVESSLRLWSSAGFQPAVSQASLGPPKPGEGGSLQDMRLPKRTRRHGRSADWKSAIQQVGNLRYEVATFPRSFDIQATPSWLGRSAALQSRSEKCPHRSRVRGWFASLSLSFFYVLTASFFLPASSVSGAVVINELVAAPSDQQLAWGTNGVPRLGSGVAWMEPGFNTTRWANGNLPAGYGFSGLQTDLTATMRGRAPSLYLRKEFTATPEQAAVSDTLTLSVEYNDGFVAYINGREVTRANCGATNRFIYASQPAYNVSTNSGAVDFSLGPANAWLRPGANVIAIQAHNAEQPSTTSDPSLITQHIPTPEFKINAGLRTSGETVVSFTAASFDFNNAAGGARIHRNTNGVVTDSTSGVFASGGWLATAANATSSVAWQGLEIIETELPGAGAAGSGGLRFAVSQTGPNQPASVRGPAVDMSGAWRRGAISADDLARTTLRFRYRTTGGAQFRPRMDPALGQEASALGGFSILGTAAPPAVITFSNAVGGARVMTVNGVGSQVQSQSGTLVSPSLFAFTSSDVRNMTYRIVEDATAGDGFNGSKGHLRAEITQAATAGASWGFSYGGIPVPDWTPGSVTAQALGYATFQFACKIPVGVSVQLWAEPGNGSFANRVDWGTVIGDGTWQIVQRDFAATSGSENFRTALNTMSSRNFKLVFQASASLGLGTWVQLDDFQIVPWQKYEVTLARGTTGQAAFVGYLNANNSVSFVPAFEKVSDASASAQTLTLDDYIISYAGTNALNGTNLVAMGAAGGPWKYFIGRAEPSGGLFDPGLLTNNFVPPAGEEADFETPDAFVDWIELHNEDVTAIDLSGWSLTDERDTPEKWHFPSNTVIAAGGYLVVLCDGREEANAPAGPATYLHANFSLSSDGEYVALFDPFQHFVDGFTGGYPKQVFFGSYGRNPSDRTQFGYLTTATPGASNSGSCFPARVGSPEFKRSDGTNDLHGGLYPAPSLTLLLTNDTPGSSIRYTLNGSDPTESNGTVYTGPLTLTQSTDNTGVVVRARSFLPGWLPSGVKTHTYLLRQPTALTNVPVVIFTGQKERTFYKPAGLLAISGGTYQTVSGSDTIWVANGPQSYNEVLGNGTPFEREVHFEYYFPPAYYPTNRDPIREDIGLRVSSSPFQRPRMTLTGAESNSPWQPWWNNNEKPSFNLFFRGDYGPKELDYAIFPNYDVKEFQHLRLRAGKNDSGNPFITDELIRRLWIDMGNVGAKGLFCSVYLNAVYKGVFNLTERIREPLFQAHYRSTSDWDVRYNYDWVNGDGIAYSEMMTALNRDLSSLANYSTAANLLDVQNFADYYLLNIYCAMWDWPENNFVFARERSTGPLGKFRYAVWDAEGGFNINGYYNKPVTFNTIGELNTKSVDVANIWKRLALSPEFRLRFADRVNKHLFNGGVLDDRNWSSGVNHFRNRFDELAAEAAPLVLYNHGQPLGTNLFTSWTAPATGRRSYLLGNTAGHQMFRDAGLWPLTEPPVFSQYGGGVPAGYSLTMTSSVATAGQTATIYFTFDGSDPRLSGGALNAASLTYTAAVVLTNISTVRARAKNNTTGEWSPLTEADFAPASVPAGVSNLVVAELMYHPPDVSTNEMAAGFGNADDFEFVRLLNIGGQPIDLGGVRFALGITFDFSVGDVRFVNPGASVLLVKSRAAFRARYGSSLDSRIAGEYAGNLSNGGERLTLMNGTNTLRDFFYDDGGAFPESPDGDGPSLLLRDPWSNPDHNQATNWVASAIPGGMPAGYAPALTFDAWRRLLFEGYSITNLDVSGPAADPDGDSLPNFAEYALGLHPLRGQPSLSKMLLTLEAIGDDRYAVVEYRVAPGAIEAAVTLETSSDLANWSSGAALTQLVSTRSNIEGTTTLTRRSLATVSSTSQRFFRLRISQNGP